MRVSRSLLVLWLLILAYGIFFSALSIQRHRAFLTHASDLGQIDQAIWNTLHGHPLEHTKGDGMQSTRLTDHVEPIFIPLSLVFLLYDNVEALLIVQSFAIAMGALAIFWIARRRLGNEWAAVAFAALYLLFPSLETANLAEFHAVTLAPAPLLFAYYFGMEKAWGRFTFFSILALAVKEEISLLVFAMAAWFIISDFGFRISDLKKFIGQFKAAPRVPFAIALLAATWFVLTVFVIIPHFSPKNFSVYTCRYLTSDECPPTAQGLDLEARLGYLGGLVAAGGWIALLDPISLGLGLPLIAANVVSNYPAQYSGTYHYSAPVAPYFILAAIGGTAWLYEWLKRRRPSNPARILFALVTFIFLLALIFDLGIGYSPLGAGFNLPTLTTHDQLFARFAAQIPPDAIVSTTSSLNPHLSHRRVLYRYPVVNDAQYVMLDVSESTTANPIDFRVAYNGLQQNFGIVDAADGYILLKRGASAAPLPNEFYSLFRAPAPDPQYAVTIEFGARLRLVGFDVLNDAYGRGSLRLYWQRLKPMDKNYNLFLFYADAQGQPRADVSLSSTLLFWYPTAMWQANETIIEETVPLDLGATARVGVAVLDGDTWDNLDQRLPTRVIEPQTLHVFDNATWVELGIMKKEGTGYQLEK